MPKKHGNLFHTMTREQFNASDRCPGSPIAAELTTGPRPKSEIMRLVAQVNDRDKACAAGDDWQPHAAHSASLFL